jgi:hypothetical protein
MLGETGQYEARNRKSFFEGMRDRKK